MTQAKSLKGMVSAVAKLAGMRKKATQEYTEVENQIKKGHEEAGKLEKEVNHYKEREKKGYDEVRLTAVACASLASGSLMWHKFSNIKSIIAACNTIAIGGTLAQSMNNNYLTSLATLGVAGVSIATGYCLNQRFINKDSGTTAKKESTKVEKCVQVLTFLSALGVTAYNEYKNHTVQNFLSTQINGIGGMGDIQSYVHTGVALTAGSHAVSKIAEGAITIGESQLKKGGKQIDSFIKGVQKTTEKYTKKATKKIGEVAKFVFKDKEARTLGAIAASSAAGFYAGSTDRVMLGGTAVAGYVVTGVAVHGVKEIGKGVGKFINNSIENAKRLNNPFTRRVATYAFLAHAAKAAGLCDSSSSLANIGIVAVASATEEWRPTVLNMMGGAMNEAKKASTNIAKKIPKKVWAGAAAVTAVTTAAAWWWISRSDSTSSDMDQVNTERSFKELATTAFEIAGNIAKTYQNSTPLGFDHVDDNIAANTGSLVSAK